MPKREVYLPTEEEIAERAREMRERHYASMRDHAAAAECDEDPDDYYDYGAH